MRKGMVSLLVAGGLAGVLAIASCSGDTGPTGPAGANGATGPAGPAGPTGPVEVEVFRATLTSAGETPNTNSPGTGTAYVTVSGGILNYRVDIANIANVTAAHIHGPGLLGTNAPVRVDFYTPPSGTTTTVTTTQTLAAGVGFVKTPGMTQDSLLVLLRNGQAYANVHTTANPGGEIRGQFAKVP